MMVLCLVEKGIIIDILLFIFLVVKLADASKSGVAQETLQNAVRRGSKAMTELEARQILGVTEKLSWEEIAQASTYNAENYAFYKL